MERPTRRESGWVLVVTNHLIQPQSDHQRRVHGPITGSSTSVGPRCAAQGSRTCRHFIEPPRCGQSNLTRDRRRLARRAEHAGRSVEPSRRGRDCRCRDPRRHGHVHRPLATDRWRGPLWADSLPASSNTCRAPSVVSMTISPSPVTWQPEAATGAPRATPECLDPFLEAIGMEGPVGPEVEHPGGSCDGSATVRERRYAEALRGSRAARTRSRPKVNSSAGS